MFYLAFKVAYASRDSVHTLLRKVFALPLLPADDIRPAFEELLGKVAPDADAMVSFFDYLDNTWMTNEVWPIDSWSVYGRSIRTNNDVEGWHNRLNRRAKKGNLSFYMLVTLLFDESRDIPLQCKLVKESKLRRYQKKSTKMIQSRLMKIWEEYGEHVITTSELLKKCSRIYGPN